MGGITTGATLGTAGITAAPHCHSEKQVKGYTAIPNVTVLIMVLETCGVTLVTAGITVPDNFYT